nr:MAG TPA: hypothetical protein [Caudoviricetes sp.]
MCRIAEAVSENNGKYPQNMKKPLKSVPVPAEDGINRLRIPPPHNTLLPSTYNPIFFK